MMKKFRNAELYPEPEARVRRSIVDDYATYLDQRLRDDYRSSTRLWRELRNQGFNGQGHSVATGSDSAAVASRGLLARPCNDCPPAGLATTSRLVHAQGHTLGKELPGGGVSASPEIARVAVLAQAFFRIIRKRQLTALTLWIVEAKRTALTRFASRLERDLDAAEAALTLPWSQGHVEGQVHRLKLIK